MKLPIYTEVSFESLNPQDLKDVKKALKRAKVGLYPTYLLTSHLNPEELSQFLDTLETAFDEMRISPKFPYPFYVISENLSNHHFFHIERKLENLPGHFLKKGKRLKARELNLLTKIEVLSEKLTNVDVETKLKILKDKSVQNKELFEICLELDIYEKILQKFSDASKEK